MSKIIIFIALLIAANLYLLRPGYWFFQDAGFWPKTSYESLRMFLAQLQTFTNDYYYLGYDQGLFNFTKIIVIFFITFFFTLFGHELSQIVFTLSGYILSFLSFYVFSGIFLRNTSQRYLLSLLYVFNPLSYSLQGHVFFNAISPLFLYAVYKYFYGTKRIRLIYLLLSLFAAYLWVSYIRFLQSNFLVIVPYFIYLFFIHGKKLPLKKSIVFSLTYFLLFLPIIFSFISQLLAGAHTAFNYGAIFGNFVVKYPLYNAFNFFQAVAPKLYSGGTWPILGIIFFIFLLFLILTLPRREKSYFYFLNLFLVIAGITFYGMANIFGNSAYISLVKFFPFIINEPFWGFYVLSVPLVMLIGLITKDRMKFLYMYAVCFIVIAILPLLNLQDFRLQKYELSSIPKPYYEYFIKPVTVLPEASYYYLGICWRAAFMDIANTPTFCPNYGYRFTPISFDDPRLVSGDTYTLSQNIFKSSVTDNFRITHNLKHIFVPNDIVLSKGPGPVTGDREIQRIHQVQQVFAENTSLINRSNNNFYHYYYRDKDDYDFFVYSPLYIHYRDQASFYKEPVNLYNIPIALDPADSVSIPLSLQSPKISYKIADLDPTKYYLKISELSDNVPFLLQFNQAYSQDWQIKWISAEQYDRVHCITEWKWFHLTNNERCQVSGNAFDPAAITLLGQPEPSKRVQFRGNYFSNGWLIGQHEIPTDQDTLYAVIFNKKQIYYTCTILLALTTLLILTIFSIIQEIYLKKD